MVVAEKKRKKMTAREELVRDVKREHDLSWSKIAGEMGFSSIGGLTNVLGSKKPHDSTLNLIRKWLARRGVDRTLDQLAV